MRLNFADRPAEQLGCGAIMGDQNRGPLPCQAAGNGGGIAHQVGIHAGEGFVHQQRLGVLAQQGAQQSRRYEDEQKELAEKIKKLRSEIEKQSSRSMTTDMFIGLVRKYTRARKLTPRMLNELIEKIEVFNAEKIDGVWEQRLRIHYNCVGTIEIPTVLPLPIPEVSVNTRKGVVVNYAPCELAV